jgi:hypothetical protein
MDYILKDYFPATTIHRFRTYMHDIGLRLRKTSVKCNDIEDFAKKRDVNIINMEEMDLIINHLKLKYAKNKMIYTKQTLKDFKIYKKALQNGTVLKVH